MARKVRLLTDSKIKKEQALELLNQRIELVEERKAHQKRSRMRSDSVKIEVIKTFVALGGNLMQTAAATGVPVQTLHLWKRTDWWKNLLAELKKTEKLEMSQRTKLVIEKSLELLNDRLENGDVKINRKTGEAERVPVPAKELHTIAKDMLDRKLILDKSFEQEVVEVSKDDRLKSLAERFAALAEKALEKPKPTVEVTDVIFAEEVSSPQRTQ